MIYAFLQIDLWMETTKRPSSFSAKFHFFYFVLHDRIKIYSAVSGPNVPAKLGVCEPLLYDALSISKTVRSIDIPAELIFINAFTYP